jgi:hypothetical protein
LDGETVGSCEYGGYKTVITTPGQHTLTVDVWDGISKGELSINPTAGDEHFYEIKPRSAAIMAGVFGGFIGATIEAHGKQCGGTFSVEPIDKNLAAQKLSDLRASA